MIRVDKSDTVAVFIVAAVLALFFVVPGILFEQAVWLTCGRDAPFWFDVVAGIICALIVLRVIFGRGSRR